MTVWPAAAKLGTAFFKPWYAYDIRYDASLDPREKRVVIAHELGHLFWMVNAKLNSYDAGHEPVSSVLGVFTMMDKNRFYASNGASVDDQGNRSGKWPFQYGTWQDVVQSFVDLRGRMNGAQSGSV